MGAHLLVLGVLLSCGGCGTSLPLLYSRQPDASLLQPCVDPVLATDDATDNDIAAERIRVARAYVACRDAHVGLVTFVKAK